MDRYEKIVPKSVGDINIKIDVDLIPGYQRRQLAQLALELTQDVFSRHGEEEHYQRWLQDRQQRKME